MSEFLEDMPPSLGGSVVCVPTSEPVVHGQVAGPGGRIRAMKSLKIKEPLGNLLPVQVTCTIPG